MVERFADLSKAKKSVPLEELFSKLIETKERRGKSRIYLIDPKTRLEPFAALFLRIKWRR